jgi:hypothetical protein
MKLTQAHLSFYREQKTPTPQWAVRMAQERKYPWAQTLPKTNVNELINSQEPKPDRRLEAVNLCHLIRLASRGFGTEAYSIGGIQRFANLRDYLFHITKWTYSTDSARRVGYAKKWYRKLYGPKR